MQTAFKNKTRLGNNFKFKDQILKYFTSGVVDMFQCGVCNELYYKEYVRHLNVRIDEQIVISPIIKLVYHQLSKNELSLRTAP